MKKILGSCFLIVWACCAFAQEQDGGHVIHKDTINLRGVLYTANSTPAANIIINSKQLDLKYNKFQIFALTDEDGYFELEGAMPQDTLTITDPLYGTNLTYMNKGSRYMAIYLPVEKVFDLNSAHPIAVAAPRKNPKPVPSFTIYNYEKATEPTGTGAEALPAYPGGDENFFAYLKTRLVYPPKAIENNVEGTVEVRFNVGEDGALSGFKILKGIGYGCDEEIVDLLKRSPKWNPAVLMLRSVATRQTVAVQFKLTDN
jgi:TonB family protein